MDAIFNIIPTNSRIPIQGDLLLYLQEKGGIPQIVTFKDANLTSEKIQLYAYLFGPVMRCAMEGFSSAGYEGVDKVKARYMLEAELCKAESYNAKTGKTTIYIESISGMSKARLHKFVTDVLFFLETELGQKVPDAEMWKLKLKTGRDYLKSK